MSYFSDHLAWQQRVNQEFKAQSTSMDQEMYNNNGQWFNYPDLINYLKTQQMEGGTQAMTRAFGEQKIPAFAAQMSKQQQVKDDTSQFSYAGKSKLLYNRKPGASTRSKTSSKYGGLGRFNEQKSQQGPIVGDKADKESRLSKVGLQRFNEELSQTKSQRGLGSLNKQSIRSNIKSKVSSKAPSYISKVASKRSVFDKPASVIQQQPDPVEQMLAEPQFENVEVGLTQEEQPAEDQNAMEFDQQEEVEVLESASQVQPSPSQISNMSGRTYISQLQKQLNEEKVARLKLEGELDELKKISSEITSHLSLIQKQQDEEKFEKQQQ